MGPKLLMSLSLAAATAVAFAAPPASKAKARAAKPPVVKKSPEPPPPVLDCKTQKTRLHHDEKILYARQELALAECRASTRPGSSRCDDMKRQQKAQRKEFKEQRKVALGQCKTDKKDVKEARHESKGGEKNTTLRSKKN